VRTPLNSSPPSTPLYTNTPGEFRSPRSALTYSLPDTLPQIHWARTPRRGLIADVAVERPPLRKTKRNGTRNTQLPLGTYRSHNPDPRGMSWIQSDPDHYSYAFLAVFAFFCLCGSVMFIYCALVLIFTFMRYFFS